MIKLKTCFYLFVIAVLAIGVWITILLFRSDQALPWWFIAMGIAALAGPIVVLTLMAGTVKNMLQWCDRYDQERDDERFLRSKK